MRDAFPGYYQPTDEEFKQLWDECLFVPDANVLLNIYRYSEQTRGELLSVLRGIQARLWLPHQVALEYQRNRINVILEQEKQFDKVKTLLDDERKKLEAGLKPYHKQLPVGAWLQMLDQTLNELRAEVAKRQEAHPRLFDDDSLRTAIDELFAGRVGSAYDEQQLKARCADAKRRYDQGIPPGFQDQGKSGERQYGDYLVWRQILDQASREHQPVVFITDDAKSDWWLEVEGKTIGPRPELRMEFHEEVGKTVYFYPMDRFIAYARSYGCASVREEAIEEVKDVSVQQEHQPPLRLLKARDLQAALDKARYPSTAADKLRRLKSLLSAHAYRYHGYAFEEGLPLDTMVETMARRGWLPDSSMLLWELRNVAEMENEVVQGRAIPALLEDMAMRAAALARSAGIEEDP